MPKLLNDIQNTENLPNNTKYWTLIEHLFDTELTLIEHLINIKH